MSQGMRPGAARQEVSEEDEAARAVDGRRWKRTGSGGELPKRGHWRVMEARDVGSQADPAVFGCLWAVCPCMC